MISSSAPERATALAAPPAAPEDVDLLRRLVEIPSLSDQERPAVEALCRVMASRGFAVEIDEVGNAIGTIGAGPKRVVLLGHIDTVPGHIPVRIEDGVLWGRGAVDAKGPLCTFVAAASAAAPDLNATVTVVGAVGEERLGSPGANAVARWDAPDFCVIGEPSGWDAVCLGYRGTLGFHCRLAQPSRHSAGPGESAGEQAIAFWNTLTAELAAMNAANEATTTFTSLTPALREMRAGNDGMQDEAVLSIGLRLPPGIDTAALQGRIRELAGSPILITIAPEAERSLQATIECERVAGPRPLFGAPALLMLTTTDVLEDRFARALTSSQRTMAALVLDPDPLWLTDRRTGEPLDAPWLGALIAEQGLDARLAAQLEIIGSRHPGVFGSIVDAAGVRIAA